MEDIKDKYGNKEFEDRLGYSSRYIMELFNHFAAGRKNYERLWKVLDAYDKGDFWTIINNKLPDYSVKPDTNWINYVKTNYVNSLYVGSYRGIVVPRKYNFNQQALAINEFIEYIFNKLDIPGVQMQIGERAALLNFGAVEFGWKSDIIDGAENLFTGELEVKPIDNLALYLDPAVKDYLKGRAIFIAEQVSLTELKNEPRFAKRAMKYEALFKEGNNIPTFETEVYYNDRKRDGKDNTVRLITCYYKHSDKETGQYRIDKLWLINDGFILDIQPDIKPKQFPIRVLYAEKPTSDCYGTPKTKLVLYNAMSINILDSIDSTLVYSALKRPKIISRRSGLNETLFAKEGNNPDRLWVVTGDPNNVVRYIDIPELPQDRILLKQRLELGIMRVSGVDDTYTGRDTGSIQTTGGMDIMNQRLTMSDNGRIANLQEWVKSVTELIMLFYLENGGKKREFPVINQANEIQQIKDLDFEDMRAHDVKFDFVCNITPNLPTNLVRLGEIANQLMEKQMQYNSQPPLITIEEWLMYQDFPQKYQILKRMKDDRMRNDVEELQSDIINYAGLVQQGVRPESAVNMLAQERQLKREQPGLGNTAGTPQAKQAG